MDSAESAVCFPDKLVESDSTVLKCCSCNRLLSSSGVGGVAHKYESSLNICPICRRTGDTAHNYDDLCPKSPNNCPICDQAIAGDLDHQEACDDSRPNVCPMCSQTIVRDMNYDGSKATSVDSHLNSPKEANSLDSKSDKCSLSKRRESTSSSQSSSGRSMAGHDVDPSVLDGGALASDRKEPSGGEMNTRLLTKPTVTESPPPVMLQENNHQQHHEDQHNAHANLLYVQRVNRQNPEEYIRQLMEMIQAELLSIPERMGPVRFTKVKQAAGTTLEEEMRVYLDRPLSGEGDKAPGSYEDFVRYVFERVHWKEWKSVQRLRQFLDTLQNTTGMDLYQEVCLVRVLVDTLKPPSIPTQSEIDNVPMFASCLPGPEEERRRSESISSQELPPNDVSLEMTPSTNADAISIGAQMDERTKFLCFQEAHDSAINMLQSRISSLEQSLGGYSLSAEDHSLRVELLTRSNYDGTMIWKIPEISRRHRDAIDGRIISLYSSPFYTSRYGYKMCLRMYLNGDGMGQGTHISLFFVLMKGEYDALLKWPFDHKVSLTLMEQTSSHEHRSNIVETFQPDPMSSSFQKPQSDMNIASGCPRFVPQGVLDDDTYVIDDTIFIKCIVDTSQIFHP